MENTMVHIRPYAPEDQEAVAGLWREVFPDAPSHNDPVTDIRTKLLVQPDLFFVALADNQIVGTVMSGFDGHRGWVYYLAVHPDYRRRGIGTLLMRKAEIALKDMGCPKLNLQIRPDNSEVQAFYESLGYEVEDRISMGRRLSADEKENNSA